MQITVTIPDELAAQAQARGLTPEGYIEKLIAEQSAPPQRSQELSQEDFTASLDALTRYSDKIPALPIEAFSRESLYADHD